MLKSVLVAATVAFGVGAPSARALTLTFDDLIPASVGTHMPDTYGGLNWVTSDWHYMRTAGDTFLALSGNATAIRSVGGADFYFDGADFWSRRGLDANGRFYYILHKDGVEVYDGRDDDNRNNFTGAHTFFASGYSGLVDTVAVVFTQGGDDWNHLAMDNVVVRGLPVSSGSSRVPEGGAGVAGLGSVLGLLIAAGRRRR